MVNLRQKWLKNF